VRLPLYSTRAAALAIVSLVVVLGAVPGTASAADPTRQRQLAAACGPTFRDQLQDTPWPLKRLQPEMAWPLGRGQGVLVAVIDSGVSTTHRKLASQVVKGIDYVTPNQSTGDCDLDGHGTLVASIIAGADSPESPFHGIAPGARILPIRVLPNRNATKDPSLSKRIADGINYAVEQHAKIINLSLYTPDTPELQTAVKNARDNNVVLVAASGNDGKTFAPGDVPTYPAAYDDVIAVAGVDHAGEHVKTSNAGAYVDLAGPGEYIEGPAPQGNGYAVDKEGGTSFAAAYVSGLAAIIRSISPDLSATEVKRRMMNTADAPPEGRNALVGAGVINPYRAVGTIFENRDTVPAIITEPLPSLAPADPAAARLRVIAISAGLASLLFAFVFVGVVPFVRRRLRPAMAVAPTGAERSHRMVDPAVRSESDPEVSVEPVVITSPSVRRISTPPPGASPSGQWGHR